MWIFVSLKNINWKKGGINNYVWKYKNGRVGIIHWIN